MSQQKTIQQLQGYVASAESKVQQTGTNLQAAQKRAEQLIAAIRSDERQRNALEAENERLSDRLDGLYSQLNSVGDDDEDGGEAAAIESEIAECQSEISENRAEIQQLEARMSRVMQELQAVQAKVKQYAELLGQYRQALQQMDQMFVGHIKERSTADSGMELLARMNYASSARQPAGQLAQDVRTCEQERQKIARLQTEITRYLGDNVTVQAPAAQKGTISGHGGTGRTATAGTGQMPGTVPRTVKNTVDNGPSHIETAKTTSADFTPPPVVSMAPPGGKSQADVSDIRQMAQQNRGKWADAAGFMFLKNLFTPKDPTSLDVSEKTKKYRKISRKTTRGMSEKEKKAVWEYTTEHQKYSYHAINQRLRDTTFHMANEADQVELDGRISAMKAVIDRNTLPTQEILYRGTKACDEIFGKDYYERYTPEQLIEKFTGALYLTPAFTSTSYDYDVARYHFTGDTILTVNVPKGAKGICVDKTSNYGVKEHEIILQAGSVFRIEEIKYDGSIYRITVTLCGVLP